MVNDKIGSTYILTVRLRELKSIHCMINEIILLILN